MSKLNMHNVLHKTCGCLVLGQVRLNGQTWRECHHHASLDSGDAEHLHTAVSAGSYCSIKGIFKTGWPAHATNDNCMTMLLLLAVTNAAINMTLLMWFAGPTVSCCARDIQGCSALIQVIYAHALLLDCTKRLFHGGCSNHEGRLGTALHPDFHRCPRIIICMLHGLQKV